MNNLFTVTILGTVSVGKTCLSLRFEKQQYLPNYESTIESLYLPERVIEGETITFRLLDTAGQQEFQAMTDQYIRSTDTVLLVYDITERGSFEMLPFYVEKVLALKVCEKFPMVIVGNKCDLEEERIVEREEGELFCQGINVPFFETSAKEDVNVEECFVECIRQMWVEEVEEVYVKRRKNKCIQS